MQSHAMGYSVDLRSITLYINAYSLRVPLSITAVTHQDTTQ